ncbi:MAG: accessory gene regulator B family protein [Clostridia bacterium]|nr:accessory gene regulator B family protein [Clostridia bacterium]MDO5302463.1 accessory gene regulator B family protein [Clostridia bacterium]
MKAEEYFVERLLEESLISENNRELYRFGFNRLILFIINVIMALIIGMICRMLLVSICFSIGYFLLRRYSGGFHVKNPKICFVLSAGMILVVLGIIRFMPSNTNIIVMLLIGADVIILMYAPKGTSQRPLSRSEEVVFKRITRKILLIENILVLLLLPLQYEFAESFTMSVVFSALMLIPSILSSGK